jgi:hypothetical protein
MASKDAPPQKRDLASEAAANLAINPDRLSYDNLSTLYAALRPLEKGGEPPMKALKSTWIIRRGEDIRAAKQLDDKEALRSLVIKRRQEMPAEAFMEIE